MNKLGAGIYFAGFLFCSAEVVILFLIMHIETQALVIGTLVGAAVGAVMWVNGRKLAMRYSRDVAKRYELQEQYDRATRESPYRNLLFTIVIGDIVAVALLVILQRFTIDDVIARAFITGAFVGWPIGGSCAWGCAGAIEHEKMEQILKAKLERQRWGGIR